MKNSRVLRLLIVFVALLLFVFYSSKISVRLWGGKPEKIEAPQELEISENMTIAEFGNQNNIPNEVLQKVFQVKNKPDLQKSLNETGLKEIQIREKINQALAIHSEHQSKNWKKILLKFVLWFAFLAVVFVLIRNGKVTPKSRKILYGISILLFGVALGSDPSPMGTIKDAIVLMGVNKAIFPPRLIAFIVFLLLVVVANKFICSWGCQIGTLQDIIFRLNRNKDDRKGIFRQYKPPFVLTNTIRILFFIALILGAFISAVDIVELIDPFKFYNPAALTILGGIFIIGLLILSLFIYRPWCHFFCPFGLVGWLAEKIAIFKIKVNYETCIACNACAKACPSNVMDAILKREKTIPDCFSCATCINVCPTQSIKWASGKRAFPPERKFEKKE